MIVVREPVVGIQYAVSKIFEQRAVKAVRSRARHNGNLPSGSASELGSKGRRLDSKFLHGIHRHKTVCPTRRAECG